jgi:hypothetical protein
MTGIGWRLLAVFFLILVAPTFLRGQEAAEELLPFLAAISTEPDAALLRADRTRLDSSSWPAQDLPGR